MCMINILRPITYIRNMQNKGVKWAYERLKPRDFNYKYESDKNKTVAVNTLDRISTSLNKPHVNRLLLGAFSAISQPFIDYFNPLVDDDTASVASLRTFSKVIVGTLVGIGVRGGCFKLMSKLIKNGKLLPEKVSMNNNQLTNYISIASTVAALVAMLGTNFLVDAPLTNKFTNFLLKLTKGKDEKSSDKNVTPQIHQTLTPKEKIKEAFDRMHHLRNEVRDA